MSSKLHARGVSIKFRRMAELYRRFADAREGLDWSDDALHAAYTAESSGGISGEVLLAARNGYYIGKQWMGVTVSMWKEDIERGHLSVRGLYADTSLPHWWLESVVGPPPLTHYKGS